MNRLAAYSAAWLVSFLLPTWAVVVESFFPNSTRGMSVALVSLTALVGCGVVGASAPITRQQKLGIVFAAVPLLVAQFFVLAVVLLILTGLEGTQ